ncbi:U-box domain-containing protein 35-like isoform X2 [Diospyros lotus]|uniref:U-box domain-containing protein 35-like isoform X2 n=1 Tax=Diospyros lotus TaxID=55363 RepID=UPI00224DB7B9|nr:U-box domain-containing protein 35-like isoform X2 [Diospyros lotus]
MNESEIIQAKGLLGLPLPPSFTVAIAISGSRKSKYIVEWALQKFVPEGKLMFKLLHVRPKITTVPTPMGNSIPISQVRDDVAAAYIKEAEWQTNEKLLPYSNMCSRKKVQVEILQIESDDVVDAISREVDDSTISNLVIGASSHSIFSRGQKLSSKIAEGAPSFCTVYVVSKGKLSSLRPSDSVTIASFEDESRETVGRIEDDGSEASCSTKNSSSHSSGSQAGLVLSHSLLCSPSLPMQRFQALSTINQTLLHKKSNSIESSDYGISYPNIMEREDGTSSCPSNSDIGHPHGGPSSFRSLVTDHSLWTSDQASISDGPSDFSSESQINVNFELEKLRIELRHIRGMYAIAQSETIDASRKVNDLEKCRLEDTIKLKEVKIKEVEAKELAIQERVNYEAARREVKCVKACAEKEAAQKREAEIKASYEAKEKEKLENALMGHQQYQKFEWEEIVLATLSFSDSLRIGMGGYGIVYKCSLHHTTAAVKILHSKETHRTKQFQQELEILSRIRHPHLLILLGACPEHGCLVYEYMEYGSLEDRLFQKNNTPPIPWFERYRIAWEVASALAFLHHSQSQPIIHRDLKPANILLDRNLVSKIGDVGLSKMLHSDSSAISTVCQDTGPVGTFCYIDPEYQRTGLISPTSDVYAFGMVILQLLTAKPAIALTHVVETAIDDDRLVDVLDPEAGNWPIEETKELAVLGLRCTELRRRDRPDLRGEVLPALERLKEFANRARDMPSNEQMVAPNHFICPISKDVMEDPCVAADGYTYDREALEIWLRENDTSPLTNLPLPNKNLLPNYTLLSAIADWKSRKE